MAAAATSDFELAAQEASRFVADGETVGLGSGRAATAVLRHLAARIRGGLRVRGIPTSNATAAVATSLGIPLVSLDAVTEIDITIDGADEVDPQLNLIKGLGGALLREKIIAAAATRYVIVVGSEKCVEQLGARGNLPVEVTPFALEFCRRRIADLGCAALARLKDGKLFVTDNGNHILDCKIAPLADPRAFEAQLVALPGVLETGLFLGMADTVVIQSGSQTLLKHAK